MASGVEALEGREMKPFGPGQCEECDLDADVRMDNGGIVMCLECIETSEVVYMEPRERFGAD
jgi:hypothetical protein